MAVGQTAWSNQTQSEMKIKALVVDPTKQAIEEVLLATKPASDSAGTHRGVNRGVRLGAQECEEFRIVDRHQARPVLAWACR
jgi:hypothetical protein